MLLAGIGQSDRSELGHDVFPLNLAEKKVTNKIEKKINPETSSSTLNSLKVRLVAVLDLEHSFSLLGVVQRGDHLALAAVPVAAVPEDAVGLGTAVLGVDEPVAVDVVAARAVADDANLLAGALVVEFQIDGSWETQLKRKRALTQIYLARYIITHLPASKFVGISSSSLSADESLFL